MRVVASAPGKLILLGEYAVLEGAPALVASVERRAEVSVELSEGRGIVVDAPDIGVHRVELPPPSEPSDQDERLAFVEACLGEVWPRLPSLGEHRLDIRINSERFLSSAGGPKLGLGSSAAVSVALVTALEVAGGHGDGPAVRHIFEAAHRAHRRAQGGVGSGLDIAASSFGGVVAMYPGKDEEPARCEPLRVPDGVSLLPVYTGRGASTTELVGLVREYAEREPEAYSTLIEAMTECSNKAIAAEGSKEFLEACASYGKWLGKLGEVSGADIVSAPHRALGQIAADAGLVYKPSGAGGGDIGLVFADDPSRLENARDELKRAGGEPLSLDLGGPGVIFTLG